MRLSVFWLAFRLVLRALIRTPHPHPPRSRLLARYATAVVIHQASLFAVCARVLALCTRASFRRALGARKGIRRWGTAMCPLDEALSRAVVDISSRPHADIQLHFTR